MGQAIGGSLPLAVGIALSPIPIVAVVLMLTSRQPQHRRDVPLNGGEVEGLGTRHPDGGLGEAADSRSSPGGDAAVRRKWLDKARDPASK